MAAFEYRTTFAVVPPDFPDHSNVAGQLSKISPKAPKGDDWQLVSTATVGTVIFYYWERLASQEQG